MAYGGRGPTKKAQARADVLAALRLAQSELSLLHRSHKGSMLTATILETVNRALSRAGEAGL